MTHPTIKDIEYHGAKAPFQEEILTEEALKFLKELHLNFESKREKLLNERKAKKEEGLQFLKATESIRKDKSWKIGTTPKDLEKRFVEITGPAERKMIINALNSGADIFMADFEDSLSPTWKNIIEGQKNLIDAVAGTISYETPEGKKYALKPKIATLIVRPRGFHLVEKHLLIEGKPISGSFLDFGLFLFHNAAKLLKQGTGPYFYLPKLESHFEARLWNEIFNFSEEYLGLPHAAIKATVLIETIGAAFEMEEILYELKEHIVGLNAGRWDYIFSIIKKFSQEKDFLFPDRSEITMAVPFMRSYCKLLVKTCHSRGAHAMGGMAAFIPSRKEPEVTETALMRVREDKALEVKTGFDGTWVAHPDLVNIALEVFEKGIKDKNSQKEILGDEKDIKPEDLLQFEIADAKITEKGFRNNIAVCLQYLESWLNGQGAVAINYLMEDAATAEISRSELWQWLHHRGQFDDGRKITAQLFDEILNQEVEKIEKNRPKIKQAKQLLSDIVKKEQFEDFLTLHAYEILD